MEAAQRLQFCRAGLQRHAHHQSRIRYGSRPLPVRVHGHTRTVYDYDLKSQKWHLKKQQPVLGDFDTANYLSERLHAKAADGTLIPISLVRRKDTVRDGNTPLLLYGYGSYGLSMPVVFSSNRLSLLDRGVICAIATFAAAVNSASPGTMPAKCITR